MIKGILIQEPIGPDCTLPWIPQIKNEPRPGPHHNVPAGAHHIPNPTAPPPKPPLCSPLPSFSPSSSAPLQNPNLRITVPVPLPPFVTVRIARILRQMERLVVVQVQLLYQIVAYEIIIINIVGVPDDRAVLITEVVTEKLFIGGVESDTRW